jgi:hypothetical protein
MVATRSPLGQKRPEVVTRVFSTDGRKAAFRIGSFLETAGRNGVCRRPDFDRWE